MGTAEYLRLDCRFNKKILVNTSHLSPRISLILIKEDCKFEPTLGHLARPCLKDIKTRGRGDRAGRTGCRSAVNASGFNPQYCKKHKIKLLKIPALQRRNKPCSFHKMSGKCYKILRQGDNQGERCHPMLVIMETADYTEAQSLCF